MNLVIVSFTPTGSGLPIFEVASGVYVSEGDASGKRVIDRMEDLPTGLVYDPDGTDDAPLLPERPWWMLEFRGANPYSHVQYLNLLRLKGKHGEIRAKIEASTSAYYFKAYARLTEMSGAWQPPYQQGKANALTMRITFRLKEHWRTAT